MTGSTVTVEGCGSDSLQGDVRFAEVMGLMGAEVQWQPYSITITGRLPQTDQGKEVKSMSSMTFAEHMQVLPCA